MPATAPRLNHSFAFSVLRSSSRGIIRYAATPLTPLAASSRASASSPEISRFWSSVRTSATTFLPAKPSGAAPGAFQVDLNFAASRIEPDAATTTMMTRDRMPRPAGFA